MRGFKTTTVESRSLEPSNCFEPPDNSKQKSCSSTQSNIVILVTPDFSKYPLFEPIFVSLGGSKNRDSTVILE